MEKLGNLILKNTVANYVYLAVRMLTAILLVRITFLGLGQDYYGYWSLLWAVFGYSLLLDFGFGQTVQKYTAEATFSGDMEKYSRILSTVLGSYLIMTFIIICGTIGSAFFIDKIFVLKNETSPDYYRNVFIIFGIGVALVFPSGIFPEVLVGMKKIYLRNYVLIGTKILELAGIYLCFKLGGSLLALAIFVAAINLCTNIIMACIVFTLIPGLKLSFKYFRMKNFREIADFSIFSYLVTIANMIIFKADRIVIGIMVGMGGVGVYQLGTRLPEIQQTLTTQFEENLSPIAASLHKAGDQLKIQEVMLNSTRITSFLTTCVFVVLMLMAEPVLYVWLNITSATSRDVITISYIMIISAFVMVTFRSTGHHFLLMAGKHRLVAGIAISESIVNLALSIALIKYYGVVGVAIGTLLPNIVVSIFLIFPLAVRFVKQSVLAYIFKVYIPIFLISIPTALFLWWINSVFHIKDWNLLLLAVIGPAAGLIFLVTGWTFYVSKDEKTILLNMLRSNAFFRKLVPSPDPDILE
jgi:O-antigen/teichoic acid export membrane protein